jgi:hypothetical protein
VRWGGRRREGCRKSCSLTSAQLLDTISSVVKHPPLLGIVLTLFSRAWPFSA